MAGKSLFKRNIGTLDRTFRFFASIFLIALGSFFLEGMIGIVVAVWGAFMLLTAFTAFCPAYVPFRISTNSFARSDRAMQAKVMNRCCSDAGNLPVRCGSMWGTAESGDEKPFVARNP